jgi:hypothetical protein
MGVILLLTSCTTNRIVPTMVLQETPVNAPPDTSATIVIAPSPTAALPPATVSPGKTITIALKPLTQTQQLLYENEHVRIRFGYDEFMARLEQAQGLEGAPQTKQRLQDYAVARHINLREPDAWYIHQHIVVSLLQSGLVSVYDKRSESYVTSIKIRTFEITYGPDWAEGHLAFYLTDGTLILDTLTWLT